MSPLKYFKNLMNSFKDKDARIVERGIVVGTGLTVPAWDEIHDILPKMITNAKMAILPPMPDYVYSEFVVFMKEHKYDTEQDIDGNIMIKMSVRKR